MLVNEWDTKICLLVSNILCYVAMCIASQLLLNFNVCIIQFTKQINTYTGRATKVSRTEKLVTVFSLIVIGPLDTKRKVNTG